MSGKRRADGPDTRPRTSRLASLRRPRLKQVLKWGALVSMVGVVLLALVAVVVYRAVDIPEAGNSDFTTETSFVYFSDGAELGRYATVNRESIDYAEMPQTIKDAVVAIENPTFWTDKGVDPKGILRAAFSNAKGNDTQGGSTITQQYVKVLYLNQERSYTRKVKEAVLALKLQKKLSKEEILGGYLNAIYFGHGSYGVQAAAKTYFQVPAAQLTLAQSAALAAVLNNPTLYDPYDKDAKKRLRSRYQIVLDKMVDDGDVTPEESAAVHRRLPKFEPIAADSAYGGQKGHMLELVKNELRQLGYTDSEIEGGGLKVTTTFDQAAMDNAAAGVAEIRPDISDKRLHVAVATVEPGTGALRGFFGGQDYLESQINWASAGGMVGSTFKPFSLATALEAGYSLKDTFDGNSPYEFPDGSTVQNEGSGDGESYGSSVSAVKAMEDSINTAFIDMSQSIPDGPDEILKTAEKMGIPPVEADAKYPGIPSTSRDLEADARITLGKARISPINMANAFATIADGGKRMQVHVVEKVVDANNHHDYDWKTDGAKADAPISSKPTKAISADISDDVSYALQQTVLNGTGANAQAIGRPAAGKTGTATNDNDAVSSSWFVGYTPQLATAVMYVRGDGDDQLDNDWLPAYGTQEGYFGANYPTRTWAAIMSKDLDGTDVVDFPPPAYVDGDAPMDGHGPVYVPAPKPVSKSTKGPVIQQPTKKPDTDDLPTQAPPPVTEAPPVTQAPVDPAPQPEPTPAPVGCAVFSCSTPEPQPTQQPTAAPPASPAARRVVRRRGRVARTPAVP